MLSVSSWLAAVGGMPAGILLLAINFRVDGLNGPTFRPIPESDIQIGFHPTPFNIS